LDENKKSVDFTEVQIKNFVEEMRPPVEIRDQLDIGYKYENSVLEIYEIRPHFKNKDLILNLAFAQTRFIKSRNVWRIYWMRASGKWELYKPHPEVKYIKDFFKIIEEDKYRCFKG